MAEQSHRDAMNDAIRAQRERHAVPRSIVPPDDPPSPPPAPVANPEPEPGPRKGLLRRLLNRD